MSRSRRWLPRRRNWTASSATNRFRSDKQRLVFQSQNGPKALLASGLPFYSAGTNLGPGPIPCAGPGPALLPLKGLQALVAGPGPPGKVGPGPPVTVPSLTNRPGPHRFGPSGAFYRQNCPGTHQLGPFGRHRRRSTARSGGFWPAATVRTAAGIKHLRRLQSRRVRRAQPKRLSSPARCCGCGAG